MIMEMNANILNLTVTVLWAACILLFVGLFFLNANFLRRLETMHQEKWSELGRPTLVLNNSIKNNLATFYFLKNRDFEALNDAELTKRCDLLWLCLRLYFVLFVLTLVSTIGALLR